MAEDPEIVDSALAEAFHAGIEASKNHDEAWNLALSTIEELSQGLMKLTSKKVSVALRPTIAEKARMVSSMMSRMLGELTPERVGTQELFARGQLGNIATDDQRLCLVHFSDDIFPIELEWPSKTIVCPTAPDLRSGLHRLIRDAQVAKKIRTVMDHFDKLAAKTLDKPPFNTGVAHHGDE